MFEMLRRKECTLLPIDVENAYRSGTCLRN